VRKRDGSFVNQATDSEGRTIMSRHVHHTHRSGCLRAAVLGANDGLLSMSSPMVSVAAAQSHPRGILTAGVAGLVAGMLSMGAGE
jgi:VIT1/CCC1 family predicted Fe2+/Mn2+ transporter